MRNLAYFRSSSTCKGLIEQTNSDDLNWVRCDRFLNCLGIEGIAIDDIGWLYKYLSNLQITGFNPILSKTYFVVNDKRLFAISQSKYYKQIRVDFISVPDDSESWIRIVEQQSELEKLHNVVQESGSNESLAECKELLYSTGCIHV